MAQELTHTIKEKFDKKKILLGEVHELSNTAGKKITTLTEGENDVLWFKKIHG